MGIADRLRGATNPLDLGLAVALAALAAAETAVVSDESVAPRVLLAGATAFALVFRRTTPSISTLLVATGVALESVATESPDQAGVLLAVLISTFSVATYASGREAALGIGVMSMSISVSIAVDPSDSLGNIAPSIALFVLLPAALGAAFRRRGLTVAALELRASAAEEATAAAVEDERRRVARELHDVVSHAVTLIAVQAEAGQAILDTEPEAARRALASISAVSRDAVAELHSLLGLLHAPTESRHEPGLAQLPSLLAGVRAAGLKVDIRQSGESSLPAPADHCAYRLVQEGLTNALRHAREPRVTIDVTQDAGGTTIVVESIGTRHQSTYGGSGLGLPGLRERLAAVGGTLDASISEDRHRLSARIPFEAR